MAKKSKDGLTKDTKRGDFKSATSRDKDWQPKTGAPFRDTKGKGGPFPALNRPFPHDND